MSLVSVMVVHYTMHCTMFNQSQVCIEITTIYSLIGICEYPLKISRVTLIVPRYIIDLLQVAVSKWKP